jgi:hypothetical protein
LGKDLRCHDSKQHEAANGDPATTKQIEYLTRLGANIPKELTKREASRMIDEALARDA